jgi:hypothetical protein
MIPADRELQRDKPGFCTRLPRDPTAERLQRRAMRNRYQKPAELPPSLEFVEEYLRDAKPTRGERLAEPEATEARRVEAITALLALARNALMNADEWANMTNGDWQPERMSRLGAMPRQLREFLTIEGLRMLTAADPIARLQWFLGHRPRGKGRPTTDNAFRDLMIAADVAELHASGKSIEAACGTVADAAALSRESVREIYYNRCNSLEVRAEQSWRALRNLEPGVVVSYRDERERKGD